jgi:hypothetical protein
MKALMPFQQTCGKGQFLSEQPKIITVDLSTQIGPVEIRRYIRFLRENRRYNITRDFIY